MTLVLKMLPGNHQNKLPLVFSPASHTIPFSILYIALSSLIHQLLIRFFLTAFLLTVLFSTCLEPGALLSSLARNLTSFEPSIEVKVLYFPDKLGQCNPFF